MQDWKFLFFSLNFLLNSKFYSAVKWWIASLRIRIVSQHPLDILRLETFLSPLTNSEFEFKFPIIKKTFDGKSFSRRFARGTPSIRVEMKKLLNFLHHRRWCSSAYDFPYTNFFKVMRSFHGDVFIGFLWKNMTRALVNICLGEHAEEEETIPLQPHIAHRINSTRKSRNFPPKVI